MDAPLTKRMKKKLDGNYKRMQQVVLNKSKWQHPAKHQIYLQRIMKTIKVRRTRHAGNCWKIKDEIISDILLWTPSHGQAKFGRPARTYLKQLCADTGYSPEDLPRAMENRDGCLGRIKEIRAGSSR